MFSGRVEDQDGSYVIEVPADDLQLGDVNENSSYRVAMLSRSTNLKEETVQELERDHSSLEPPVEEGETRTVDIESVGEQGDGSSHVEHGYVVIVSDTGKGEQVRIEITQVRENVAFADVVERLDYYE